MDGQRMIGHRNNEVARAAAKKAFLAAFRNAGVVRSACAAANIESNATVYRWRKADPEFAAQWEIAQDEAADILEAIAIDRARRSPKDGGSDVLLIFLLKALRPHKYRENVHLSGHVGVTASDMAREADAYLREQDASVASSPPPALPPGDE